MPATLSRHRARCSPLLLALLLLGSCGAPPRFRPPEAPEDLRAVAEASGYTRTATYDQVNEFLEALAARSTRVRLSSIGTTTEGRSIPLAVIADPPVVTWEDAEYDTRERIPVLLIGNIHAGEVCGKEALLMLARELALAEEPGVLEELIVCVLPIYNADGNERFAPDNRPGQIGPEEMGIRTNAQGLDLNRDYIKAEAPETRALIRFLNQWDPSVIVDTHTTNGSQHRYTLTYQGPKHPSGDPAILGYVRDRMLPDIDDAFERTTGYNAFFYGNFRDDHTKWVTYPAEPRYGVAYRGLRNRLSIITEAYAYAPYRDRVLATYAFCETVLAYTAAHKDHIRGLVEAADKTAIYAGRAGAAVHLRTFAYPFPEKVTVLGYETEPERDAPAADAVGPARTPRDYEVDFVNYFVPTLSIARPRAYAIPPTLTRVIDHLRLHSVDVWSLDRPAPFVAVEAYTIAGYERAEESFQGHRMISRVEATPSRLVITLEPGTVIVPVDQPLGALACFLLEPRSSDGLVAWNFLDDHLTPGATYPILRVLDPLPAPDD